MAENAKNEVKVGSNVILLGGGAKGELLPAKVTKVHKDGCVDVELTHRGEEIAITRCPRDDEGKKTDSYRPVAVVEAAEEAAAGDAGGAPK